MGMWFLLALQQIVGMEDKGTTSVTCLGCAMLSFLLEDTINFLCMMCKLVAILEKKKYVIWKHNFQHCATSETMETS